MESVDKNVSKDSVSKSDDYSWMKDLVYNMINDIRPRKCTIMSADVKALYVEVRPNKAAEKARKAIVRSDWQFETDVTSMGKYIATNMSRNELYLSNGFSIVLTC